VRRLPFDKNLIDAVPTKIMYSGGLLAVVLSKNAEPFLLRRYIILDSMSGEQRGFYEPSEETGSNDVCFSRKEGLEFLHNERDRLSLISSELK